MNKFKNNNSVKEPVFFRPNTRYELLDKMKQGIKCETFNNLSSYNNKMIKFYMKQYKYKKIKSINKGMVIYEPII